MSVRRRGKGKPCAPSLPPYPHSEVNVKYTITPKGEVLVKCTLCGKDSDPLRCAKTKIFAGMGVVVVDKRRKSTGDGRSHSASRVGVETKVVFKVRRTMTLDDVCPTCVEMFGEPQGPREG